MGLIYGLPFWIEFGKSEYCGDLSTMKCRYKIRPAYKHMIRANKEKCMYIYVLNYFTNEGSGSNDSESSIHMT